MIEQHLPHALRALGPGGLAWWQWIAIPLMVVLALLLGALLGWVTRRILGHLAARTETTWDDELLERLSAPITLLWTFALATLAEPILDLGPGAAGVLQRVVRSGMFFTLFWAGFRSVNVAFGLMSVAPWTRSNPSLAGFLPSGRKFAKIVLLALGAVAVLSELGFQVASLLAGLGIGGIALALAAQKTVEHLIGSVAIGIDQPFRIGDFVKVDDVVGTVESIGLRSTRIRTLDRTLVTLPNGKLADMKAETFAARDRIRLLVNLALVYSTRSDQLRRILREVEDALRAHPRIWPDTVSVRFTALGDSSLNVEVMAWFVTTDWNEFTGIRQDLLLRFMEIVERAGSGFAFPTRTIVLDREASGPVRPEAGAARRG
ncbi:MAG: mechanosensitive ion channel family protein [Anaeromyxobacter sp.]